MFATYPLDVDGSDLSGNHGGSVVGTPSFTVGKFANGVDGLGSISNYVSIPDHDAFSPFLGEVACSFWVKATDLIGTQMVIGKHGGSASTVEWHAQIDGGNITLVLWNTIGAGHVVVGNSSQTYTT